MSSFYLLFFFIGIIVVVYWTRQNDGIPSGGKTKGVLRMTPTRSATVDPSDEQRGVPSSPEPSLSNRPDQVPGVRPVRDGLYLDGPARKPDLRHFDDTRP
jgi:hypothetical protein